ncbi:MAG: PRTRC system ThiF family protein [Prevotella sp.]|jgi:PRTRC genetic system ThiF family protein|nr:PRTRC system ThiF family protein [Prevotella sp.]
MKQKMHFTDSYLLNPTHPVTVSLIGCGGTGSQVLTALSRISHTLTALGHPGLHVTAYDPDTVTEANLGRQLFSVSDTGLNKAVVLITRINRFFSTGWEAVPDFYDGEPANIIITCTDTVKSRLSVAEELLSQNINNDRDDFEKPIYWLDLGNTQNTGQVILGTFGKIRQPESKRYIPVGKLPCVTERFDLAKAEDRESGPSCSLAEAIERQDLFINSTLANIGSKLLWKLFREGMTSLAGVFLNMDTMKMNPVGLE